MQKSSFFTLAALFIVTQAMPTICMELALNDIQKKQLTLELYLQEGQPNLNEVQIMHDRYNCKRLGIDWKENNNSYTVENGIFTPNKPLQPSIPYHCFEFIGTQQVEQDLGIKIPKSLPSLFVEKLKTKNRILTLKNDLPVEIIVHLKCIYNNSGTQIYPINLQKRLDEIDNKKPSDNQSISDNQKPGDDIEQPQTNSKFKTYIIPAASFAIVGIIAWLIYLHKNNLLNAQIFSKTN